MEGHSDTCGTSLRSPQRPPGPTSFNFVFSLAHPQDFLHFVPLFLAFLIPLNSGINSRVRRVARQSSELVPPQAPSVVPTYRGGSLFQKGSTP